ncbi:MAG: acyl-CoA dehydrogenase [Planctomycetota bacterium]
MDFVLDEQQQMILDMTRQFADEQVAPTAAETDRDHKYPAEIVSAMGELGLMGIAVSEEYGGAGMGYVEYVLALTEISRACASTGVIMSVNNSLVCYPFEVFGTEEQKQKYLVPLASGEKLGAFSLSEAGSGTDAGAMSCRATLDGDEWVLDGTKLWCTNGKEADIIIVFATIDPALKGKGICAFIVEKGTPGFEIGKLEDKLGIRGSSTAEFVFENCRIPKENLLGPEGKGMRVAFTTLDAGRIGIAAQALGVGDAAIAAAAKFANEREQFGQPIGNFQAIQWMLADSKTEIESARLLTLKAASLKDAGQPFTLYSAMCKLKASEAASFCANKAIQIHGGYGYTTDYPVERYLRDAKITEIYEGTSEAQRMVISRDVLKG